MRHRRNQDSNSGNTNRGTRPEGLGLRIYKQYSISHSGQTQLQYAHTDDTLVVDDCWSVKTHRDPITNRMIPDPARFPDGIASLAAQIHDLGLKVGIYSSAGETTCAGYPASLGYEDIDAETFAEWGIDCTSSFPPPFHFIIAFH